MVTGRLACTPFSYGDSKVVVFGLRGRWSTQLTRKK